VFTVLGTFSMACPGGTSRIRGTTPGAEEGVAHSTAVVAFHGSRTAAVKKRCEAKAVSEERTFFSIA
jgi:Fe-S-cluster-containing hydrogenase component 2